MKSEPSMFIKMQTVLPKGMSYFGIFRLEFEKTIFIFDIKTQKFVYTQSFIQNERTLNVGPKTAQLKIFESSIQKEKTLNVGPKMSYLGILG